MPLVLLVANIITLIVWLFIRLGWVVIVYSRLRPFIPSISTLYLSLIVGFVADIFFILAYQIILSLIFWFGRNKKLIIYTNIFLTAIFSVYLIVDFIAFSHIYVHLDYNFVPFIEDVPSISGYSGIPFYF